jgi:hypothetical protein
MIAVYSARSSCPRPMPARQVVLPTLPNSSHSRPLLSRQQSVGISPLHATLMGLSASVANKRLTPNLTPLDATLTKNTGGTSFQPKTFLSSRPTSVDIPTFKPLLVIAFLSFHTLTNAPSRKPLRLTSFQMPGGYGVTLPQTTNGFNPLYSTAQTTPPFFVYTVPVLSSPLCVRGIAPFLLRWRSS